jgi:hypothetical protein
MLHEAPRPEPRHDFVERLAARLRAVDNTETVVVAGHDPAPVRRWRVALPAFAALAVVLAIVVQTAGDDSGSLNTIDSNGPAAQPENQVPTTVPSVERPTTTTVPPTPTTTVVTDQRAPAMRPPTREEPVRPTTTVPPKPEPMRLACSGGSRDGTPFVTCTWSRPDVRGIARYRIWREHNGTKQVLATVETDMTQYADRDVESGAIYQYLVEAIDGTGKIVGRTPVVRVTCCQPARV